MSAFPITFQLLSTRNFAEKALLSAHPGVTVPVVMPDESPVAVKWRTSRVTVAAVRDHVGIFDVHWSLPCGWSCSCGQVGDCSHVLAVQQTVDPPGGRASEALAQDPPGFRVPPPPRVPEGLKDATT